MSNAQQPTRAKLLRRIRKLENENAMLRQFRDLDQRHFQDTALRAIDAEWRIKEAMAALRGEDFDDET